MQLCVGNVLHCLVSVKFFVTDSVNCVLFCALFFYKFYPLLSFVCDMDREINCNKEKPIPTCRQYSQLPCRIWIATMNSFMFIPNHNISCTFKFPYTSLSLVTWCGMFRFCVWKLNGWTKKIFCRHFVTACKVNRVTTVTYGTVSSNLNKSNLH